MKKQSLVKQVTEANRKKYAAQERAFNKINNELARAIEELAYTEQLNVSLSFEGLKFTLDDFCKVEGAYNEHGVLQLMLVIDSQGFHRAVSSVTEAIERRKDDDACCEDDNSNE